MFSCYLLHRFNYNRMYEEGRRLEDTLFKLQQPLLEQLLSTLEVFKEDEEAFHENNKKSGPTVPGLSASEAHDRVTIVKMQLDTLIQRWQMISEGQRLFGLPVTDFPNLTDCLNQMAILNRLYSLYEAVKKTVGKFLVLPWLSIDVEAIAEELNNFQNRLVRNLFLDYRQDGHQKILEMTTSH